MGQVYQATDTKLNRQVAPKRLAARPSLIAYHMIAIPLIEQMLR